MNWISFINFLNAGTIAGVLGSVIPSVIGFAIYLCRFFIKVKQKGWRNLNEADWRDLEEHIEREFSLVSSSIKHKHHHCEHCMQKSEKLAQKVEELQAQLESSKQRLIAKTSQKIQENKEENVVADKVKKSTD